MAALRLFQSLGWPVAVGLLIALLAMLVFPQLRPAAPSNGAETSQASSQSVGQTQSSYANAVDRAAPAVVSIYTRKATERRPHPLENHPLYRHLLRKSDRSQNALGSGVIVDPRGYLLTNEHVIKGAEEILVVLHDQRETRAKLVGTDPYSDLAVLKIELDQLTAIEVGKPSAARVGDVVLAIGNPFGVGQTVTQGILSATGRWGLNITEFENFLQTDAAINIGNSGGPLVDTQGKLLGINTAILGESNSISFAIPADSAIGSLREIIEHGRVVRGWLGLEAESLRSGGSSLPENTDAVLVTAVMNDSPAQKAGLQPGDLLTHINDRSVGNGRAGMDEIVSSAPGTRVTLRIVRSGEPMELQATIAERPMRLAETG